MPDGIRKLKVSELAQYRATKLAEQGGLCPLTGWKIATGKAVADHCHKTGFHRSVLHSWANSTLGRIENWARRIGGGLAPADFLRRCAAYIEWHEQNPSFLLHHTHKSPQEKKEAQRKKAAATRKAKREAGKNA